MHCWFNIMAHKPWITAEFVIIYCSMSVVSKTVMSWFSCAYQCRLCMDLPEVNSTTVHDLHCEQPALVCHGPQLPCVNFLGLPSRRRCALAVALHGRGRGLGISHARNYPRTFSLHEIFKCTHLKIYNIWPLTDIHTTSKNTVTLVWGSLRLAPINFNIIKKVLHNNSDLAISLVFHCFGK